MGGTERRWGCVCGFVSALNRDTRAELEGQLSFPSIRCESSSPAEPSLPTRVEFEVIVADEDHRTSNPTFTSHRETNDSSRG